MLLDLDLKQFIKQFRHLELNELAMSCTLLITDAPIRAKTVKSLLDGGNHMKRLKTLEEWRAKGLSIPLEDQVWDLHVWF